jgi:hypothetical protein
MQTATPGSDLEAKPRVDVPGNFAVTNVYPTSAGRLAKACRL